jgi:hypothetical protein
MNSDKKKVLIELIKELILSTMADDAKIKELDESIDPASINFSTHLALTIKQFINEELD